MTALVLVGFQNDYLTGGLMAVPQGTAIIPLANQLEGACRFVVATQAWHPANHRCFAANHGDRQPGETLRLKSHSQILQPVYCVQNSPGAELAPGLMRNRLNRIFRLGTDPEIASHSAFFNADGESTTGLHAYLREKRVNTVYVLGMPTETTVKLSALDSAALGFRTFVVEDACRAASPEAGITENALAEMSAVGITMVHSRSLLDIPRRAF